MKITVRNVPDGVHERLKRRAERNRRSLNAEVLEILEDSVETSIDRKRRVHGEIGENPSREVIEDPQSFKRAYRRGLE